MQNQSSKVAPGSSPRRTALSGRHAILLAAALGFVAGYVDVAVVIIKKYTWYAEHLFGTARDFPWSLPLAHATLMLGPGILVALANRLRPGSVSLRVAAWLFAAVALWGGLLRLPAHGAAILALAAGLGRPISQAVVALAKRPRVVRVVALALVVPLPCLMAVISVWPLVRESRQQAALPSAPPKARNVVLIVWDTVRAYNLSAYGYLRDTTPHLRTWARRGVGFKRTLATAPWTVPSHSSLFTGRWPFQLNTECRFALDVPVPTLAEYLAAKGYETAGFAANTSCCSWESGLDRGFLHFEDYPRTPLKLFARTVPGRWLLKNLVMRGDAYAHKWLDLESRDAEANHDAFLRWLDHGRRRDRPFFAFLNDFDAHMPYVPAPGYERRFSPRPKTANTDQFLIDYAFLDKNKMPKEGVLLARDCYDECIAYLDDQFGRLLAELAQRKLLEETVLVFASDHGEGFGDHLLFGHNSSVFLDQAWVPLVIAAPGVPADLRVDEAVSLRDVPATILDLLGLSEGSPLPGRTLAVHWRSGGAQAATSPALSLHALANAFRPLPGGGPKRDGLQMSLVAGGRQYLRDGLGLERLYDLRLDPYEERDLVAKKEAQPELGQLRRQLLEILDENPGTPTAEDGYLTAYRKWLETLVGEPPRLSRR